MRVSVALLLGACAALVAAQSTEPTSPTTTTPTSTSTTTMVPKAKLMSNNQGDLHIVAPGEVYFVEGPPEAPVTRTLDGIMETLREEQQEATAGVSGALTTGLNTVSGEVSALAAKVSVQRATVEAGYQAADSTMQSTLQSRIGSVDSKATASSAALSSTLNTVLDQEISSLSAEDSRITSLIGSTNGAVAAVSNAVRSVDSALTAFKLANPPPECAEEGYIKTEAGRCIMKPSFQVHKFFPDVRTYETGGLGEDIEGREHLSFIRRDTESYSILEYQDSLGFRQRPSTKACQWNYAVDGQRLRSSFTHSSNGGSWRITSSNVLHVFDSETGIGPGSHNFRIRSQRSGGAYECLTGWENGNTENMFIHREHRKDRMAVVQRMPDRRSGSTSWADLPNRAVLYKVQEEQSFLEVVYNDVLGFYGRTSTLAMRLRLVVNNAQYGRYFSFHSPSNTGWHIEPATLRWYIPTSVLRRGTTYQIKIQWMRGNGCSEMLAGWENGNTQNVFMVTEQTNSKVKFSSLGAFRDRRSSNSGFTDIPDRVLSYTKQKSTSALLVTYTDTIGYRQRTASRACLWRVLVNGNTHGTRVHFSHGEGGYHWTIFPRALSWYVQPGKVGTGNISFKIQVANSGGGAHECLAGWENSPGFLRIEEVDPY